jgi:hypothetical protein
LVAGINGIIDPDDVALELVADESGVGFHIFAPLKVSTPQAQKLWGGNVASEGQLPAGETDENMEISPRLRITGADEADFRSRQLQFEQKLNKLKKEGGIFRLIYPDETWIDYWVRDVTGGERLFDNRFVHHFRTEDEVTFVCAPFGVGQEELVGEYSSSDRVMEIIVPEVGGSAEALARAEVFSPNADVWELQWSRDARYVDETPTAKALYAAQELTPVGGATRSVATIDGKAGVSVVRQSTLTPNWAAMLDLTLASGEGLTHRGVAELLLWVHMPTSNKGEVAISGEYAVGDLSAPTSLEPIYFPKDHPREGRVVRISLGQMWLRPAERGDHQLRGRVLVKSTAADDDFDILDVGLRPVEELNGRAAVPVAFRQPAALLARDEFNQVGGPLDGQSVAAAATIAGPKLPSNAQSLGSGIAWSNPSHAQLADNAYAEARIERANNGPSYTQRLAMSEYGFAIPIGAAITGIEVTVERRDASFDHLGSALNVRLYKTGAQTGEEKGVVGVWPSSDAPITFGSPTDLWGTTWSPAQINSEGFGAHAIGYMSGVGTARFLVDVISITVYYNAAGGQAWDSFGDADDLEVDGAEDVAKRAAVGDASVTGGRYAIAGATASSDVVVGIDLKRSAIAVGPGERMRGGVLARLVDENNWLFFGLDVDASVAPAEEAMRLVKRVGGGAPVELDGAVIPAQDSVYRRAWIQVDRHGRYFGWASLIENATPRLLFAGQDNDLAEGGPLDDGKAGFYDVKLGGGACTRSYDNFVVWVPPLDAVIFEGRTLELSHDRVEREVPEGGRWRSIVPEVDYLKLAPAGLENRKNRLTFIASPNDPALMGVGFPEELKVALYVTPRYRGVPDPA